MSGTKHIENEPFLTELAKFFQKSRSGSGSGSVSVTMKRYDGRTKPIPKNVKEPPAPAEYKCLFRAKWGNKKIATVVNAKDVNKFQLAYAIVLKSNMDALKKRDKKVDKDKKSRN